MRRRLQPGDPPTTAKPPSIPPPEQPKNVVGDYRPLSANARMAGDPKPAEKQPELPNLAPAAEHIGEEREPARPPPQPSGELEMGLGTQRIVSSLFEMPDAEDEYRLLRECLRTKDRASTMSAGRLLDELNEAADRAQRGAELLAVIKAAHDDFELLANVSQAAMHERAVTQLLEDNDARKAEKQSVKRVNKDDVQATIATMFPDEWADLSQKRSRSKRAVAVVESLADRLQERERDLRAMVVSKRGD